MSGRSTAAFVVSAALSAAVLVAFAPDALAKKKKESYLCKFGGKTLKFNLKPSLVASYTSAAKVLLLSGNNKSGSGLKTRLGQFSLVGSTGVDIATATFPLQLNAWSGAYAVGGAAGGQGWASNGSMTVTLTGFDPISKRVTGQFSGTMEPGNATPAGTVTISDGKFSLDTLVDGL